MSVLELKTFNHFGDHVCLTAVAENIHRAMPECSLIILKNSYSEIYNQNPNITVVLSIPNGVQSVEVRYEGSQRLGDCGNLCHGYTMSAFKQLGVVYGDIVTKPILYTPEIKSPVDDEYVVISPGYQIMTTVKNYGRLQWQQLIDAFPDTTFVQVGLSNERNIQPYLNNAVNLVNKLSIPLLLAVYANAKAIVGPVSACTHIAAAYNVPCIAIVGNRLSDKLTDYPNVIHAGNKLGCGPCMKFYAGVGTQGKCCTNPAVVYNLVVPACMVCDIREQLRKLL